MAERDEECEDKICYELDGDGEDGEDYEDDDDGYNYVVRK